MEESYEGGKQYVNDYQVTLSQFIDTWSESVYESLDDLFLKENEKVIADAVLTLFRTRHDIEIFKKKALYIYIREMTDCETPHLTRVISILKEDFKKKYQNLYDQGLITNKPL